MADDPNLVLRAELVATLEILIPQIRGLHALALVSSDDLAVAVTKQIHIRERRRDLLAATVHAIDGLIQALATLDADGYPTPIPDAAVPADLLTELQGEETDMDAAVDLFALEQATSISVLLGIPTEKPPSTGV